MPAYLVGAIQLEKLSEVIIPGQSSRFTGNKSAVLKTALFNYK